MTLLSLQNKIRNKKKSPPVTGGLHRGINGSDYNILDNTFY